MRLPLGGRLTPCLNLRFVKSCFGLVEAILPRLFYLGTVRIKTWPAFKMAPISSPPTFAIVKWRALVKFSLHVYRNRRRNGQGGLF